MDHLGSDRYLLNLRDCSGVNRGSHLHKNILRRSVGRCDRSPVPVIPSLGSHLLLGESLRKEVAQLALGGFVLHCATSPCAWPFGTSGHFVVGGTLTHDSPPATLQFCPTKRAPDVWDASRAAFSSIFLASSFSCSQTESTPTHTQVTQTVSHFITLIYLNQQ